MTRVHVFGAAGFAGAQLAALVDRHPSLELGAITARGDAGRRLVEVAPEHRVERRLELADPGRTLTDEEIEAAVGRVREALEAAGGRLRS